MKDKDQILKPGKKGLDIGRERGQREREISKKNVATSLSLHS